MSLPHYNMSAPNTSFRTGSRVNIGIWGSGIVLKDGGIYQIRRGMLTGHRVNRTYPSVTAWKDSFKSTPAAFETELTLDRNSRDSVEKSDSANVTIPRGSTCGEIVVALQTMFWSTARVCKLQPIKKMLATAKIERLKLEIDGTEHSAEQVSLMDQRVLHYQKHYDATPPEMRSEPTFMIQGSTIPRVLVNMGNGTMQPIGVHTPSGTIVLGMMGVGRKTFAELGIPLTGKLTNKAGEVVDAIPEFWVLKNNVLRLINTIPVTDPVEQAPQSSVMHDYERVPAGAVQKTQEQLAAQWAGHDIDANGCLPCGKQVRWGWRGLATITYLQDWQAC